MDKFTRAFVIALSGCSPDWPVTRAMCEVVGFPPGAERETAADVVERADRLQLPWRMNFDGADR